MNQQQADPGHKNPDPKEKTRPVSIEENIQETIFIEISPEEAARLDQNEIEESIKEESQFNSTGNQQRGLDNAHQSNQRQLSPNEVQDSDRYSLNQDQTPPQQNQALGTGLESKRQSAATCNTKQDVAGDLNFSQNRGGSDSHQSKTEEIQGKSETYSNQSFNNTQNTGDVKKSRANNQLRSVTPSSPSHVAYQPLPEALKDEPIGVSNLFEAQLSPMSSDGPTVPGLHQQIRSANTGSNSILQQPQTEFASNQAIISQECNTSGQDEQTRVVSDQGNIFSANAETLQGTGERQAEVNRILSQDDQQETTGTGLVFGIQNVSHDEHLNLAEFNKTQAEGYQANLSPEEDGRQQDTLEGAATGYVLGESQALNFDPSDQDQEAMTLADAAGSPLQQLAYEQGTMHINDLDPQFDQNFIYGQQQAYDEQQAVQSYIIQAFKMDQNLLNQQDDFETSVNPQHAQEELQRMQQILQKEATSKKMKFIARQKRLLDQVSLHENKQFHQGLYHINRKTTERLAKQLNNGFRDNLQKERVSQRKDRKQKVIQEKQKRQQSFEQNLKERKNKMKQDLEASRRAQEEINQVIFQPSQQAVVTHKIRHMKMSSYFPSKKAQRQQTNMGKLDTEHLNDTTVHEQFQQSRVYSMASDAGPPAVVRLKLAKLKQVGEQKMVKPQSQAESRSQKRNRRSKPKKKLNVPSIRASMDVRNIEDSYAELSINPAPDIFHNDALSLKTEMIDHAKATRVRSQLKPVLGQLRNQAFQDYFSSKNEQCDKSSLQNITQTENLFIYNLSVYLSGLRFALKSQVTLFKKPQL